MKKDLVFAAVLVILCVAGAGCLRETGTTPVTVSPTATMNASATTHPTEPTPVPTTLIPREQSGVRIFSSADSVCIGDELYFGLVNEGNSTIEFSVGNPLTIQILINGTWGNLYNGGGTQAFWNLKPGKKRIWHFPFDDFYSYFDEFNVYKFPVRPGLYRIQFFGKVLKTNEPFAVATEITMKDC
jgi:hypothetical protein